MVYQYVVTLRNDKGRIINVISLLLIILSAAVFLMLQIKAGSSFILFGVSFALILLGLCWVYFQHRNRRTYIPYSRILLVVSVTWLASAGRILLGPHTTLLTIPAEVWIGIAVLLLALLERPAKLPLEIGFSDDRIVINTLLKKRYDWQDFNNIILKDGLLTLDFKNNKLLQKQTLDDDEDDADEDEFNAYCQLRLKRK